MTSNVDAPEQQADLSTISFPDALATGTTVLLCNFDPTKYALSLRCLRQFGGADDSAIIVTMDQGVEDTVDTYVSLADDAEYPSIGVVDMVSEGQSITAAYNEVPTVFTPSQGDTERLVLALSELSGKTAAEDDRHLVVRSLSPMLSRTPTDRVVHVLERISGLKTEDGLAVFGLDYTRHDEETVTAIAQTADRVLWVTLGDDGEFAMDLRSARADFTL